MSHSIIVSDTTFSSLDEVAKQRGLSLDSLLDLLAQEALMKPLGQPRTGEEFLRFLGADEDEIAAPMDDADQGAE